jgi:hypothetical protein
MCITDNYFLNSTFALKAYERNYDLMNFLELDFSEFIYYPEFKLEKNPNAYKVYNNIEEAKQDRFWKLRYSNYLYVHYDGKEVEIK